ncbi:MAG: helix-turn-helix transcriptional regulator [Acidobacteria bacterium]|jgi:transcriptional regulator with XRE-family HTH domain|nr:helix-turn-helix transcriptional regulator [Acidobacteriota bacterium]
MRKHETSATDIGLRLKNVRQKLGIQQKDVAAAMKVAPSYLSEIENGKGNPGPEFFVRLASLYNINLNYLFMGIGDMLIDAQGSEKKPGIDMDGFIETVDDVTWMMEKSVYVRNEILSFVNKILFEERDLIKDNIKRMLAKEEAEKNNP